MLLTITTTQPPATDLGFLLMKNPANVHEAELTFGRATVFFPEADEARCTAALSVEVDPVMLVRGKMGSEGLVDQYVNDRPYAASSLLSVALGRVFGTALSGRSKQRPELAETPCAFSAMVTPLPVRGERDLPQQLFGPLGYEVATEAIALDPAVPEWGDSFYVTMTIKGKQRLADLLAHLYVLIPVLDNRKHYYIGDDEVEKLLNRGEGWLPSHPQRELITKRYLRHRGALVRDALARLTEAVEPESPEAIAARDAKEETLEQPIRLNDARMAAVLDKLKALGARSVLDLGCGEGRLLRLLLADRGFDRIVGVEVAPRLLALAADRLRLERLPEMQRKRIQLLQGSLMYRDERLTGFDAAALVEVIEHLDADRLHALESAVFAHARPKSVIVTTPNREYNALFENLAEGKLRHPDHRFEWMRGEFTAWADRVGAAHGYSCTFEPIGDLHPENGAPTQMAVFTQC
jgi:3' terminal RNA ribose 2'-O-methyltransferase Hen1